MCVNVSWSTKNVTFKFMILTALHQQRKEIHCWSHRAGLRTSHVGGPRSTIVPSVNVLIFFRLCRATAVEMGCKLINQEWVGVLLTSVWQCDSYDSRGCRRRSFWYWMMNRRCLTRYIDASLLCWRWCMYCCERTSLDTHTHTHNCFTAIFLVLPGRTNQKKWTSSGLYGAREDNRSRHIDHQDGCHSIRTSQWPISIIPPFLYRLPFLQQPSHFILHWDRHQMCWLAYPVAWLTTTTTTMMTLFNKVIQ